MYQTKSSDFDGRIAEIEAEISKTKYNKKTQHHIGLLKARIAELKDKAASRQKSGGTGYTIKKSGDATVALLGFPSVGKSTLLNAITNAVSKIGAYDFTTLDVIPGLLNYENAKIQIFDVPGIVKGAADGSGRGKEVLAAIRSAELIMVVVDWQKPKQYKHIMQEVWDTGIRLNQQFPDVKFKKMGEGGIDLAATCKLKKMTKATIKEMLREMGIMNCQMVIREDINDDQLIDVVKGNRMYIPGLIIINKADLNPEKAKAIKKKLKGDILISADKKEGLDQLKELIFKKLRLIRVYLKEQGKEADLNEPMIMREGTTVRTVCEKIHRNFLSKFKCAKVWGSSKFPGQIYGLDKEIKDKDVVEVHLD
ncbi:GTP-binding protein [Candidatus Woesearchaeota archaeon]|nr:GTP-binding protein [Candidatus Woesearchaeota archaeon]MBT4368059.1 GTP-binding protein [Candidatus Woesearchaeota archaeon]MBT4712547.1 GTP-binding protein [Candidatus Woesearchaeota archaeon]MBT6639460.1 GTP-binding protein [Candidatus Woesearchaeota archaeon]MBT7133632.1 GTP-binding protein [Candidatus Woesearchaeota archaeon]